MHRKACPEPLSVPDSSLIIIFPSLNQWFKICKSFHCSLLFLPLFSLNPSSRPTWRSSLFFSPGPLQSLHNSQNFPWINLSFHNLAWCFLLLMLCYAKSLQSCPTLCNPIDGSPPGSPVPGILQARTLEWAAISFSNAWKWKVKVKSLSRVRFLATPWIAAYQAPPSVGFSKQEYWSGVPLPSPFALICISFSG